MKTAQIIYTISFLLLVSCNSSNSGVEYVIKTDENSNKIKNQYLYDNINKIRITPNYTSISAISYTKSESRFYLAQLTPWAVTRLDIPNPLDSFAILNKKGKVILADVNPDFPYNASHTYFYQFYKICYEAYKMGKEINGHGRNCNNISCIEIGRAHV